MRKWVVTLEVYDVIKGAWTLVIVGIFSSEEKAKHALDNHITSSFVMAYVDEFEEDVVMPHSMHLDRKV